MAVVDVPTEIAGITTGWLTTVLDADGAIAKSAEVTSFTAEALGEKEAFLGTLFRLTMSYSRPGEVGPRSLVAKFAPAGLAEINRREVEFYAVIATGRDLPVPWCYYGGVDGESGTSILLLEDLSHLSSVDFVAGCTPAHAAGALSSLSRVHTASWESSALAGFAPAFSLADLPFEPLWAEYPARIGHLLPDFPIPPSFYELGDLIASRTPTILAQLDAGPVTSVHRDLHVDNLLFDESHDPPRAAIVDWQFVGRGRAASDVGYLLISSLPTRQRRDAERSLVGGYHSMLLDNGVHDYSFDECWLDYRLSAVAKLWMTVAATVLVDNADGHRRAWRAADLQRLTAFVDDQYPQGLLR